MPYHTSKYWLPNIIVRTEVNAFATDKVSVTLDKL